MSVFLLILHSNTTLVKVKSVPNHLSYGSSLHSNTTLVKVKWRRFRLYSYILEIQIQLLLKLNFKKSVKKLLLFLDSNTTLVKVKFGDCYGHERVDYNSNTTLVKVKFAHCYCNLWSKLHSNTTLVKVKL